MTRRNIRLALQAALILFGTSMAWSIDPPVLVSPANGATDQPVLMTLSWNAVAFADSYLVQIADDSLFETIIVAAVGPPCRRHPAVDPGRPARRRFDVLLADQDARDGTGTLSAWSIGWRFRTIAARPGIPVLSAPATNATGIALTDTLRWNVDAIADAYRVEISTAINVHRRQRWSCDTTVGVQWGLLDPEASSARAAQQDEVLLAHTVAERHRLQRVVGSVELHDDRRHAGSARRSLTPAAGAQSQLINPTTPTWTAVTDAATYRLQIATDAGFTSLVYQ